VEQRTRANGRERNGRQQLPGRRTRRPDTITRSRYCQESLYNTSIGQLVFGYAPSSIALIVSGRRVEDDMRPSLRTAMKNIVSESKAKHKESLQNASAHDLKKSKGRIADSDDASKMDEPSDQHDNSKLDREKGKGTRRSDDDKIMDFARTTSSAPKRLNDIVLAPPDLKVTGRLKRGVISADKGGHSSTNVVSTAHKRMMELEREKAIRRYRELKEAKLIEKAQT